MPDPILNLEEGSAYATAILNNLAARLPGTTVAQLAAEAARNLAQTAATTATTQAALATTNGAAQTTLATAAKVAAELAKVAAELARDASFALGPKYTTEALGRAAVADGAVFLVQGAGEAAAYEYRRTSSTVSVLIATYPSLAAITSKFEINDTGSASEYIWGVADSVNKVGLALRYDGSLLSKHRVLDLTSGAQVGANVDNHNGDMLAIADASGRVALRIKASGVIEGKVIDPTNLDQSLLVGIINFLSGAQIGAIVPNHNDDLLAITDANGKVGLRIKADGSIEAKLAGTDPALAASLAAMGVQLSAFDTRVSRSIIPYGMPKTHQWGEWYLRETRQRLRKRALGEAAQLTVAAIGDSWTHTEERWTGAVYSTLVAQYGDAGGGYTGFAWGFPGAGGFNGNINPLNIGMTIGASWTTSYTGSAAPDLGMVQSSTPNDPITLTGPVDCSVVNLFYVGVTGAEIRYQWNGGAWTTVFVQAGGQQTISLAGVPAIAWTLNIEVVTNAPQLCGVDVQKTTSGIRFHKLGSTGSKASDWSGKDATQWKLGITALAPNLVIIMHGTNDQSNYNAEAYRGYMQTIITRVKESRPLADILLMAPCENGRGLANLMSSYAAVLYELAVQNKCAYLDLQYVFGDSFAEYSSTSARPWFNVDTVHPDPATGGRVIADAVLRLLTQS